VVIVRESLVLFERNYISSYLDKLPEANTVGFLILFRCCKLNMVKFTASFLRFMLYWNAHFYCFYTFSRLLHVPIRLIKEVVRVDGLW
jgi:hypothetical protein